MAPFGFSRDDWITCGDPGFRGGGLNQKWKNRQIRFAAFLFLVRPARASSAVRSRKRKSPAIAEDLSVFPFLVGRDDWIRTSDPLHPMQVRYRAALRPVIRGANLG